MMLLYEKNTVYIYEGTFSYFLVTASNLEADKTKHMCVKASIAY